MLSFGVRVPIYRSASRKPELAQRKSEELRARSELEVQVTASGIGAAHAQYVSRSNDGAPQDSPRRSSHRKHVLRFSRASRPTNRTKTRFQALLTRSSNVLHSMKLLAERCRNTRPHRAAEQITGLSLR